MLLAIDPGPTESAWLKIDSEGMPATFGHDPNHIVLAVIGLHAGPVVIEMIASYGMPVGAEVFETCVWIGRFDPICRASFLKRIEIKSHLCHSAKANDSTIRQALIDRFGGSSAIGRKATPGPLYGITGDVWAALAVAVTAWDRRQAATITPTAHTVGTP